MNIQNVRTIAVTSIITLITTLTLVYAYESQASSKIKPLTEEPCQFGQSRKEAAHRQSDEEVKNEVEKLFSSEK